MKALVTVVGLMVCCSLNVVAQDTNVMNFGAMPPGMSGCYGTEQAVVLKVFSADDGGARFRAYQVKWHDQDVIVSDMFGTTDFKEGARITFMAQNIQVPIRGKEIRMLQFMIMDARSFMPEQGVSNKASQAIGAPAPQPER